MKSYLIAWHLAVIINEKQQRTKNLDKIEWNEKKWLCGKMSHKSFDRTSYENWKKTVMKFKYLFVEFLNNGTNNLKSLLESNCLFSGIINR